MSDGDDQPSLAASGRGLRIGLTGGIASGKSFVVDLFAKLGVDIIDTDVIAREVVEPGQPALLEIRKEFGASVLTVDGHLDRRALRQIVFDNDSKRRRLEQLLHPRIRAEAARQANAATYPYHIVVVPLLAESPMRHEMDRILVVDCDPTTQLARLRARDAESATLAQKMIDAQASQAERLAIADDVIDNNGSKEDTEQQVVALHERYLSLVADRSSR